MKQYTYTVHDYFDVWASEDGGWAVNDQLILNRDFIVSTNDSDKEILESLVKAGYLATSDMRRLVVRENGEIIEVYQKKDMIPLLGLYPNY